MACYLVSKAFHTFTVVTKPTFTFHKWLSSQELLPCITWTEAISKNLQAWCSQSQLQYFIEFLGCHLSHNKLETVTRPTFTPSKWPPNQGLPPCMLDIEWTASTAWSATGIVFTITVHKSIATGTAGTGMTVTETTACNCDASDAIKVLQKRIILSLSKTNNVEKKTLKAY